MTGILGGFTTFSAFGVDTIYLLRKHEYAVALGYVIVSVVGGIAILFVTLTAIVRLPTRGE
jgi:CrcB protein